MRGDHQWLTLRHNKQRMRSRRRPWFSVYSFLRLYLCLCHHTTTTLSSSTPRDTSFLPVGRVTRERKASWIRHWPSTMDPSPLSDTCLWFHVRLTPWKTLPSSNSDATRTSDWDEDWSILKWTLSWKRRLNLERQRKRFLYQGKFRKEKCLDYDLSFHIKSLINQETG